MPEHLVELAPIGRTVDNAWQSVEDAIRKHHHDPDLQAARMLYACVAAHRLDGPPVWPMLVAPPGSMKTELLNGLNGLSNVHFIDTLTPQTFISGQIEHERENSKTKSPKYSPSLLHRIGSSGIIAYPDFSTVIAMKRDFKAAILADMRRIYDGELSKEYGTASNIAHRTWKGKITFLVAITPAIDGHYSIFQSLGERFIMVRWPRATGIEAALSAMNQDNEEARSDLKIAVQQLLKGLPDVCPTTDTILQTQIAALSEITAKARTHIPRSGYNKEIIYVPEAESATRLAQQFAQLAKGSALLGARSEVTSDDIALVKRAAFDSMPPIRKAILQALVNTGVATAKSVGVPGSTFTYAAEELALQDLITQDPVGLTAYGDHYFTMAGLLPESVEYMAA